MRTLGSDKRPISHFLGRRRTIDKVGPSVPVLEPPQKPAGYPGGPSDRSLLVRYEHHVARRLWFEEERGPKKELKVARHGTKLKERVPHLLLSEVDDVMSRSETSSFHIPFGEMTITLDDVASLLHLPIGGLFRYPEEHVTEEMEIELGIQYLGVERGEMARHVRNCSGSYYTLQWLYNKFVEYRAASSWAFATRAYLMMLVGCTIFADKTFTLVEARYLLLFKDLQRLSAYSWASAALVTLYRHLGDAFMFSCKQLGGYPTLLQIHEYFPTLGRKGENWRPSENHGLPRAMRWSYKQEAVKVDELRLFGLRQSDDDIYVEWIGYDRSVADVVRDTAAVRFPSETVDG
ncbi:protein MAIN-LIKE 1-like [Vicia villosa]|uniref:protein MAIN-LIKE 1-like n=1 Tax=Vicia villosa TaxID=3911 RepID=UPI00273BB614|nr:protein MAIN-LIKE 1-like [Vicia villosa]